MLSIPNDSFSDTELTIMAIQIMQDLQNKANLDPSDDELTNLAMEIMKDLSTSANVDPNDPYISKLDGMDLFDHDIDIAAEISDEINDDLNDNDSDTLAFEPHNSSSSNSSAISYTNYTNTNSTDHNMVYIEYPQMSPQIVSSNRLLSEDSFMNDSIAIPPIPSPPVTNANKFKFPGNKKRAVNGWMQQQKVQKKRENHTMLPYIRPPPLFIETTLKTSISDCTLLSPESMGSDVPSCISPRDQTPKQRFSPIPDFSLAPPRTPAKKIPKVKRNVRKKLAEKHPAKKGISALFIDTKVSEHVDGNCKQIMSVTPIVKYQNKNRKYKGRKVRAKSIAVPRQNNININMQNTHVESDHGFLYINPYKL